MNSSTKRPLIEFGPFRLDLDSRLLWRESAPVHLTPKVFDLLTVLVENQGRTLSKAELMRAVWPDRHVDEANLTQSISVLRKALGETETATRLIATFPGKGYQFQAPVRLPVPPPVSAPSTGSIPPAAPMRAQTRRPWWWAMLVLPAAGVAWWLSARPVAPATAPVERRVPFSRLPGGEYQPVHSPQGTKVAFTWESDDGQPSAVLIRGVEDDEPRALTRGPASYASPAWSPDGKNLAMLRHDGAALKLVVMPERGGAEREVTTLFPSRYGLTSRQLDWSPDGRSFVISDKEKPEESFRLFLVDAQSGARRALTSPNQRIIGDLEPRFSPDGRRLLFIRLLSRFHHDVFVVPTEGGPERQVSRDDRRVGGADWSGDGQSVYWSSDRDGQFRLWGAPVQDRRAPEAAWSSVTSSNPIQFSLGKGDQSLVISDFVRDLNIWRVDLSNNNWQRVIASTGEDTLPQLSPDGRRLCFHSDRSGAGELWVSDADGHNASQLTRGSRQPVMGRWSADSKSIFYSEVTTQNVLVVDAAGGLPRPAAAEAKGFHPIAAGPNGRVLLTAGEDQKLILASPSAPPKIVAREVGFSKVLAPDGVTLYHADSRTSPTISRIRLDTLERETLIGDLAPGYWGAWALHATGVYYQRQSRGRTEIAHFDFATRSSSTLWPVPGTLPTLGTSAWSLSPDGRILYIVRSDNAQSDLVLTTGAR